MELSPGTLQLWSDALHFYDLSSTFAFGFAIFAMIRVTIFYDRTPHILRS
jgi:hypothetical protein